MLFLEVVVIAPALGIDKHELMLWGRSYYITPEIVFLYHPPTLCNTTQHFSNPPANVIQQTETTLPQKWTHKTVRVTVMDR